jgi:hypothetical protein
MEFRLTLYTGLVSAVGERTWQLCIYLAVVIVPSKPMPRLYDITIYSTAQLDRIVTRYQVIK